MLGKNAVKNYEGALDEHNQVSHLLAPVTAERYCTQCGHLLSRKWLATETRERDVCLACNHVHYGNPKVLVAGIIYWRDQIVLCRRAADPARGLWSVPMGYLEMGETLEEAISRELYEETRLKVPAGLMKLYAVCSLPHIDQVHAVYRAKLTCEPRPIADNESTEVRLFSEANLPVAELAFVDLLREPFMTFFRQLRERRFKVLSMTLGRETPKRLYEPWTAGP
jgi:ADP-ribose pyrophosphatase YjhB (NUDIX family)